MTSWLLAHQWLLQWVAGNLLGLYGAAFAAPQPLCPCPECVHAFVCWYPSISLAH